VIEGEGLGGFARRYPYNGGVLNPFRGCPEFFLGRRPMAFSPESA